MPKQTLKILTLGDSLSVGLKTTGEDAWFDSFSIEGSTWGKNFAARCSKYLEGMLRAQFADNFEHAIRQLHTTNLPLFEHILNLLSLEDHEIQYIKRIIASDKKSSLLRTLPSEKMNHLLPKVQNTLVVHNGMRSQGFSALETDQNAAAYFPSTIRNSEGLPDIVLTCIGVNDLRKDQRHTRAILEGARYLDKLREEAGVDEASSEMIDKTCGHLSTVYTPASVELFKHWCKHGNCEKLLRQSLQIFNINVRLAHTKAYAAIGRKIARALEEAIFSVLAALDDSEHLEEAFTAISHVRYFSLDKRILEYEKFLNAHPKVNNLDMEELLSDWKKVHALNNKMPSEKSAAESLAEGEIEDALAKIATYGVSDAHELLCKIQEGEISLFQATNIITSWYAQVCVHFDTKYCSLVSPKFYNAFDIFDEAVVESGDVLLERIWTEIASIFPNTYCIALNPFTKVYAHGKHPYADGLHWVNSNYKDLSLPISMAIVGILHGLNQDELTKAVAEQLKEPRTKPVNDLYNFANTLRAEGKHVERDYDFVNKALALVLRKLKLSDEQKSEVETIVKKYTTVKAIPEKVGDNASAVFSKKSGLSKRTLKVSTGSRDTSIPRNKEELASEDSSEYSKNLFK